jgi:hypothetical protein
MYRTDILQEFAVNGTALPDINFDIGESYAGRLPISDEPDSPEYFFWFVPTDNEEAKDEITIWLNVCGRLRILHCITEHDSCRVVLVAPLSWVSLRRMDQSRGNQAPSQQRRIHMLGPMSPICKSF